MNRGKTYLFAVALFAPNSQEIMASATRWHWRPNLGWGAALGGLFAASALAFSGHSEFIYFNF